MSYQNLMMYLSTIPQYEKPKKEDSKDKQKDGMQEVGTFDDLMNSDIQ